LIKRFENCLRQIDKNIIDTLEHLSRKGIRMCLISNAERLKKRFCLSEKKEKEIIIKRMMGK